MTSAGRRVQAQTPFLPFRAELPIMPELAPVVRERGVDVYDVDIREGLAEILPGFQTPIYGYEGIYPGPTIRARKGRAAIVRQTNRLTFDSNVHLHGGYVPAAHDGHPMDVIAPGGTFDYSYPNDQEPRSSGTTTTPTGAPRARSTTGCSRPTCSATSASEELELPQGEYDVPLIIADHAFNKDGSFRYAENVDLGFRGDTILVNGAVAPRMRVERRIYRLRLLNASNARSYELRLGQGPAVTQIASDGGLLSARSPARRSRCTRPSGSSCWSTSARFRPAPRSSCRTCSGTRRPRR